MKVTRKRIAVCGMIGAGKTELLKRYKEKYGGDIEVFYEEPDPEILKRYYKHLFFLDFINKAYWYFLGFFIINLYFFTLCWTFILILSLLFSLLLYVVKKYCKSVLFDTQIYFLSLRMNTEIKKKNCGKNVAEDRSFLEDELFPLTQFESGLLSRTHFNIYKRFFDEYVKVLEIPDLFVYLDVTPEIAYRNVNLRIKNSISSNERFITLDYLKKLCRQYEIWKHKMFVEYGKEKFIVIDNNKEFFTPTELHDLINK
jgi:deoxyadenosine/deoxycytidine kinase